MQALAWQEDPWLDAQQKELLSKLTDQSSGPLHVETWARAGVVQRLDLDVPSGATSGSTLEAHAQSFLAEYGALWKLGDTNLQTVATRELEGCSSVTFQRVEAGLPIVNATLRVVLTPDGRIRAVTGRMSGEAFSVDERQASVEELGEGLSAGFGRDEVPPEAFKDGATEVVFDPFFSGDSEHEAVRGWMWEGHDADTGALTRAVVVSQASAAVVFAGQLRPIEPATPFVCEQQDPQLWLPEVEYDELSGMPLFVGMSHFGGLKTTGSDDVRRALSAMQFEGVQQLYGDADPASHLGLVEQTTSPDGRVAVTFRELWDGIPVEGAWVTVVLSPAKRAERIHSRFVYFPGTPSQPTVAEPDAQTVAVDEYLLAECGNHPTCRSELTAELVQAPVTGRLAVFSGLVFQGTSIPGTSELAWGYELPRRELWVSATSGLVLASYARHALDLSMPWDIQKGAPFPAELQIIDGGVVPGVSVDPDVAELNTRIIAMADFVEARHKWAGAHGDGGWEHFYVSGKNQAADAGLLDQNNATFCASSTCGPLVEGEFLFGRNAIAADVVGHEWGHGIVYWGVYQNGRGPQWACEGRSVQEHLADVIGETAFPSKNGAWTIAEDARMGAVRNMSQPSSITPAGGLVAYDYWPPGSSPDKCQQGGEFYQYAGPANRAATFIADGFNGRPGIGRSALEELYWQTLAPTVDGRTANVAVLGTSSRYRDLVRALHATCVQKQGSALRGVNISPATCDMVNRAFVEVGFLDRRVFGVTQVTRLFMGDTAHSFTAYKGLRLHRGCTLTNQRLTVIDDDGRVRTSDWNDSPQMTVNYGSEFGVRVTARGSATDPTDRSVEYSVGAKWFGPWTATIFVNEDIALGAGVSQESECFAPVGFRAKRLVSAQQVNEWPVFLDGNRGELDTNIGVSLPSGCQMASSSIGGSSTYSVVGTHWHRDGTTFGDVAHFDHHSHGYTVVQLVPGTYAARLGWWHSGTTAIFARVVYNMLEPLNGTCQVPGSVIEVQ